MNYLPDRTYTNIIIDESGCSLPVVERLQNGIKTKEGRLDPTGLHQMFVDMAEDFMIYDSIVDRLKFDGSFISDLGEYLNHHTSPGHADELIKALFRVKLHDVKQQI